MRFRFVNCGISGDSSSGMLGRLNQNVFSNNPTVVTLNAGMNDVGRDLYSFIKAPDDAESRKRNAIDGFVADKLSQKDDTPERTEYYLMLARTYLKEIDNEQGMLARIREIEDEIYRINKPAAYAYSLEMSQA